MLTSKDHRVKAPNTRTHQEAPAPLARGRRVLGSLGYAEATQAMRPAQAREGTVTLGTAVQQATRLDDRNSMRPGSDAARRPPPDLSALERKGYIVYPVASMNVLNSDEKTAGAGRDAPLTSQKVGGSGYNVVTSGTFYSDMRPVGAVMRDGKMDTPGVEKARQRGGVAVLRDGTIVVGRMQGSRPEDLNRAFGGTRDNPVEDFMGGGALLIEGSKAVSSKDLEERQRFDQGGKGIASSQMRTTDHVVVAIRDGQAFVVIARAKNGAAIQRDLLGAGFDSVVKLDGGSGAYFRDDQGRRRLHGANPTGLGIVTR